MTEISAATQTPLYTVLGGSNPDVSLSLTLFPRLRNKRGSSSRTTELETTEDLANLLTPVSDPGDKTLIPLMMKCKIDGDRKAKNAEPPYLVILDVDHPALEPVDAAMALLEAGVPHLLYTTYSHTEEDPRYRIITPIIVPDRANYRHLATELFRLIGVSDDEDTPLADRTVSAESWAIHSGFFVPVAKPDAWCSNMLDDTELTWEPPPIPVTDEDCDDPPTTTDNEVEGLDPIRAASALESVACSDCSYEQWIEIGMALESTGDPLAQGLWDEWSANDSARYDSELVEAKWESFGQQRGDGSGITIATLFRIATDEGWTPPRDTAFDDFGALTDEEQVAAARTDQGSPLTRAVRKLSDNHALVVVGGDTRVVKTDKEKSTVSIMKVNAFKDYYNNRIFQTLNAAGNPVNVGLGSTWMISDNRRSYMETAFRPQEDVDDGTFNFWRKWPWRKVQMTDEQIWDECGLILEHARNVVCSGNEDHYRWLLAWMAQMVQDPGNKPGTAVVLRSGEGTGKGALGKALEKMCGNYATYTAQTRQLTGNFNAHLERTLFLFADELDFSNTRKSEQNMGVLKSLITEGRIMIEAKGIDARQQDSCVRVLMCSNNDFVVPAGPTARRFSVLDVSEEYVRNKAYFTPLWKQINGKGPRALFCYLRDLNLDEYPDPREPLQTGALIDQKITSLEPLERWWFEALDAGKFTGQEEWEREVACDDINSAYAMSLGAYDRNHRAIGTQLGMKLRKLCPSICRERTRIDGERVYAYKLPSLKKTRKQFEQYLSGDITWEN